MNLPSRASSCIHAETALHIARRICRKRNAARFYESLLRARKWWLLDAPLKHDYSHHISMYPSLMLSSPQKHNVVPLSKKRRMVEK